jgi:hypothetical protein
LTGFSSSIIRTYFFAVKTSQPQIFRANNVFKLYQMSLFHIFNSTSQQKMWKVFPAADEEDSEITSADSLRGLTFNSLAGKLACIVCKCYIGVRRNDSNNSILFPPLSFLTSLFLLVAPGEKSQRSPEEENAQGFSLCMWTHTSR